MGAARRVGGSGSRTPARQHRGAPADRLLSAVTALLLLVTAVGWLGTGSATAAGPPLLDAPTLTGPVSPGTSDEPVWTYRLPAELLPSVTTPSASSTVTVTTTTTAACALYRGAPPALDSDCGTDAGGGLRRFSRPLTTQGAYEFAVRAERVTTTSTELVALGGLSTTSVVTASSSSATVSAAYAFDATAPGVTLTGPVDGPTGGPDSTPVFTATVNDASATTVTCSVAPAGTADCSSGSAVQLDLPTDGTYTLTATATDAAGLSTTATATYVLDRLSLVIAGPGAVGAPARPSWTFTGEPDAAAVSCVLDGPAGAVPGASTCTADGYTAPALPSSTGADYTLTVTVTDRAGNTGTVTAPPYRFDDVAELTVTAPDSPGDDRRPRWGFASPEPVTVVCRLTGPDGALVPGGTCAPDGYQAPELPETSGATYQLSVTASDARSASTVVDGGSYRLDTTLEAVLTPPRTPGNDKTPTWVLSGEAVTATCVLETATGTVVTGGSCSPLGYTAPPLPETAGADYVLGMTVADAAGNTRSLPDSTYHLDTEPIDLTVTGPTGPSTDRSPRWAIGGEVPVTLTCALTGPAGPLLGPGPCTTTSSFAAPELTGDGDYTLSVTAFDAAGNATTLTRGYDLDTLALTVSGPTGPSPDRTPTWTFTDEPYTTADCVLSGPGVPGTSVPCTTTASFTAPALPESPGASYVLTVTVTDSLGTTGTFASAAYRLDTQAPGVTVTGPTGPSRDATPSFVVDVDEPGVATCTLVRDGQDERAIVPCPGTPEVTLTRDGTHELRVSVTDAAGLITTTTGPAYVLDLLAPAAPQISPSGVVSSNRQASWAITGETGLPLTCRLSRDGVPEDDWTSCADAHGVSLTVDGTYLLEARSSDVVGPGAVGTATWVLDTAAPATPGVTGPSGPAQTRELVFAFAADPGTTSCRVLRGATTVSDWQACDGATVAVSLVGEPDGSYVVEVRVDDAAGNSTSGASAAYVLDTTAPRAVTVLGPAGPSAQRSPAFSWDGEPGTTAECSLGRTDSAVEAAVACASPYSPTLGTDGVWSLSVRLSDVAGNVGEAALSGGYVLDTTAPAAPGVSPPSSPGRNTSPSWTVVGEAGTTLECRLSGPADAVGGDWSSCTGPVSTPLAGQPDGGYTLEVRATDAAGNAGAPGSGSYQLDTTAPPAPVLVAPVSPGRTRAPVFTFTAEPGTTARCRVTLGAVVVQPSAVCASPFTVSLADAADGGYALGVRLDDAAGNTSALASGTYVLDTTAPAAPLLTLLPASPGPDATPTWAFTAGPGTTFTCRVTFPGGAVREVPGCSSPTTADLAGQPDGSYVFTVRAVDAAGNVGVPATTPYVLDGSAPAGASVLGPPTPGSDRTPTWQLVTAARSPGTSAGSGPLECRLTRGTTVLSDWAACAGSFSADLFGQPDGTYALAVRVRTGATGASAVTTSRYVLQTTAPGAPVVTAPFNPSTDRAPTWIIASSEPGVRASCRVLVFGGVLLDERPCAVSAAGSLLTLDLRGLGDGAYTLVTRLTNATEASGPEVRSVYVLDTSAPPAVGVQAPASPSADLTPTWQLTSVSGARLECTLTGPRGLVGAWAACESQYTAELVGLEDGTYVLAVRGLSAAGTPGPETSSPYVLLTLTPGAPSTLLGPRSPGRDRAPSWTFTLPAGASGSCRVVRGERVVVDGACASPFLLDLNGESDGTYVLSLRARDGAGNLSLPAVSAYRLVTVAPPVPTVTLSPGGPSSSLDPTWGFSVPRPATGQCRVLSDGALLEDWTACTTRYRLLLSSRPDGAYVLQIRSVDAAGNTSAAVSDAYVLDRRALPLATFPTLPASPSASRGPVWELGAPGGAGLECRSSAGAASSGGADSWTACPAGRYRMDLATAKDGRHRLEVRVVDAAGTRGPPSTAGYLLDTAAPGQPRFTSVPAAAGIDPQPAFDWDQVEAATIGCRLSRGSVELRAWTACDNPHSPDLRPWGQGAFTLELRATDEAGNTSAPVGARYRYDTTAPVSTGFLSRPPAVGSDRRVTWIFPVPADSTAACAVSRDRVSVVAQRACGGRYDLDLVAMPAGTYVVTVLFTDTAGNRSAPLLGSYQLGGTPPRAPADRAPIAVVGVRAVGASVFVPAGAPAAGPPVADPGVDRPASDLGPVTGATSLPPRTPAPTVVAPPPAPAPDAAPRRPLREPPPVADVPEVLADVVKQTITKPTLPLALLGIVMLFLVAQNRIDRRDPKLAAAPLTAEPELDFTPFRPGGTT